MIGAAVRLGDPERDARAWAEALRMVASGWTLPELPRELVRETLRGDG